MLNLLNMICWIFLFSLFSINAQECGQASSARFNCIPEDNPTQDLCTKRNCCWDIHDQPSNLTKNPTLTTPLCWYPSNFTSYEIMSNTSTNYGLEIQLYTPGKTYLKDEITNLTVQIFFETQRRIRVKILDSYYRRYEVPLSVPIITQKADPTDYEVDFVSKPFGITVTRKSTNQTL